MMIRPETALREQRLWNKFLESRCLSLSQELADVSRERDALSAQLEVLKLDAIAEAHNGATE